MDDAHETCAGVGVNLSWLDMLARHQRKSLLPVASVCVYRFFFLTSICGECPVCSAGNMDSRLHRRKATIKQPIVQALGGGLFPPPSLTTQETRGCIFPARNAPAVWPLQPGTRKRRCGDGRGGTSSALTQEGRKQAQQNIYFLGRIMEAGGLLSVIRHNTDTFICPHLSRQGQETLALCSPINSPAPARGSIVRVFVWCVWSPGGLGSVDGSDVKGQCCEMGPFSANANDNSDWPWLFNSHSKPEYLKSLEGSHGNLGRHSRKKCVCDLPCHQHKRNAILCFLHSNFGVSCMMPSSYHEKKKKHAVAKFREDQTKYLFWIQQSDLDKCSIQIGWSGTSESTS